MTTTSDLISRIRLAGAIPANDNYFSNSDYLSFLDSEMLKEVVPLLNKTNEEYFLTSKTISVVLGKTLYRIPSRAVGSSLRDVQLMSSSSSILSLNRLYEEDRISVSNNPKGYFLSGNQIELSPVPTSSSDTIRMPYIRRPSKFVLPIACAEILSIDTALMQVIVSAVPSTMSTGILTDFVQANSPYDILSMDAAITGISGSTISYSSLPDDLAVGDYVCLANQTCTPGVPEDLIPILIQAALCACLASRADKAVELELQKLSEMKTITLGQLLPRVKSNDKKIINSNSFM